MLLKRLSTFRFAVLPGLQKCHKRWFVASTDSSPSSAFDYCVQLVRINDFENYLCTLRLPKHARIAGFAVRAFNVEVAKVMDSVSEDKIGHLRFQFWKDVLHDIYLGYPRPHPVASLLSKVIHFHSLNKIWFNRLITAREKQLGDQPFQTLTDIEEYGESSVSPVLYLILESIGIKDLNADHVASHIGRAVALVTVLRGVPYYTHKQKTFLPIDLMQKHKVSEEDVIRQRNDIPISNIVYEIACQAQTHLLKGRSMRKRLSNEALTVCLPAVSCGLYLEKLQSVDFDVFHPSLQRRNFLLPINILFNSLINRF